MPELVYVLSALVSTICAILLIRGYFRTRTRLLLWVSIGFVGLSTNNILLIFDFILLKQHDLRILRDAILLVGLVPMVFGLITES